MSLVLDRDNKIIYVFREKKKLPEIINIVDLWKKRGYEVKEV